MADAPRLDRGVLYVRVQVPYPAPVEFSNFSKSKFSIEIIELITLN